MEIIAAERADHRSRRQQLFPGFTAAQRQMLVRRHRLKIQLRLHAQNRRRGRAERRLPGGAVFPAESLAGAGHPHQAEKGDRAAGLLEKLPGNPGHGDTGTVKLHDRNPAESDPAKFFDDRANHG